MTEEEGLRGVTSNPSIFDKSITKGKGYEQDILSLAGKGITAAQMYETLTVTDIREAAAALYPIYDKSGGADGYVSLEPPPEYAYDIEGTLSQATRLFRLVGAPNLMIKVPATPEGVVALRRLIASGINVNATLLFSPHNYAATAQAYVDGLNDLAQKAGNLKTIASVASVFVSRIDTAVDKRLQQMIATETNVVKSHELERLQGRAALANAEVIYHIYRQRFSAPDFQALAAKGAQEQRLLWGSTSTKNPSYSDVKYVNGLIGRGTVNTLPQETWTAFQDHGTVRYSLGYDLAQARVTLDRIEELGIDMEHIHSILQKDGVAAFTASLNSLLSNLDQKRKALAGTK